MMPLRKMRSRSLAVVELVLSLSVSKAGCMAVKNKQEEDILYIEKAKQLFYSFTMSQVEERLKWELPAIQHYQPPRSSFLAGSFLYKSSHSTS